jgi:hypothetical protein
MLVHIIYRPNSVNHSRNRKLDVTAGIEEREGITESMSEEAASARMSLVIWCRTVTRSRKEERAVWVVFMAMLAVCGVGHLWQ